MKAHRKIRRTAGPCRYGTLEVAQGAEIEVPAGVAAQLVSDKDEGWEFVDSGLSPEPAPLPTSRRPKPDPDSKES